MLYDGPANSTLVTVGNRQTVVSLPQQETITVEQARQAYDRLEAARKYLQHCLQTYVISSPYVD
jgi:hypothetical protein